MLVRFYHENVCKCRSGGGDAECGEGGGGVGEIRGRRTRLTTKANAKIQYRGDREFIAEAKLGGETESS
jgi:hypothetical protein